MINREIWGEVKVGAFSFVAVVVGTMAMFLACGDKMTEKAADNGGLA